MLNGENLIAEKKAEVSPAAPFTCEIPCDCDVKDLTLKICDENGEPLIDYKQPVRGTKKPISPRLPAKSLAISLRWKNFI